MIGYRLVGNMRATCLALVFLLTPVAFSTVWAGTCTVPGTHPTIQDAIDDAGCNPVELANQTYNELLTIGSNKTIFGPNGGSAEVLGQVVVTGGSTVAMLSDFRIESGCSNGALRVTGGAQMIGSGMTIVFSSGSSCGALLMFEDGFEN